MNINLSPVLEDYIQQQLNTGLYQNASEVVREALRLKIQQDQVYQAKLVNLRQAVNDGLNSGDAIPLDMSSIVAEAQGKYLADD